jgi:hypothetical protein
MNILAKDLFELQRPSQCGGTLSRHLPVFVAARLVGERLRDERECL